MHFTRSDRKCFENQQLKFLCIFCDTSISASLGKTSNILTHLKKFHQDEIGSWLTAFEASTSVPHNKFRIDQDTYGLVNYFISTNHAASNFDSKHFKFLMRNYKIALPCSRTFSDVILTDVFEKIKKEIESLLQKALTVCLISDIWTNKQMLDFMGLAANITTEDHVKETVVIGMMLMPGIHNAENIKKTIEQLVNQYDFNKSVISGKFLQSFKLI